MEPAALDPDLTDHPDPGSTVAEPIRREPIERNVGDVERTVSILGGGALALYGLLRRDWSSGAAALASGWLLYRGITGHCPVFETLEVSTAETQPTSTAVSRLGENGIKVEKAVIINRPAGELYTFWRELKNLPKFMSHLESITTIGQGITRWVAKGPFGTVFWDAEIIKDEPGRLIAWQSVGSTRIDNVGLVRFTELPGDRGTEVHVRINYRAPLGKVGVSIVRVLGDDPAQAIEQDLRHLKQIMEAGEIASQGVRSNA
jgi:uncharacterized membrane protein